MEVVSTLISDGVDMNAVVYEVCWQLSYLYDMLYINYRICHSSSLKNLHMLA